MGRKRTGIQISGGGDLAVVGGSLGFGDTLAQNEYSILIAQPGEFKADPLLGVGIADMVGDNDVSLWKHKIREAFRLDGLSVSELEITGDGKITRLEAHYD